MLQRELLNTAPPRVRVALEVYTPAFGSAVWKVSEDVRHRIFIDALRQVNATLRDVEWMVDHGFLPAHALTTWALHSGRERVPWQTRLFVVSGLILALGCVFLGLAVAK